MLTPSAPEIATRFGLHRAGRDWRGNCPSCGYRDAFTLTLREGRALAWCASCQDRAGIGRLLHGAAPVSGPPAPLHASARAGEAKKQRVAQERALSLWRGAVPVPGTLAERYLAIRHIPHLAGSAALRFRADCSHPADRARWPALLALVTDAAGEPVAVHRTFLARDGRDKAVVEPQKASLGPVWGGAIRLDPLAAELVIGEGIETSASAGLLLHLPAWAAISAGNLGRGLVLPAGVRSVVIAADHDAPGIEAAEAAAARWQAEGRFVRIAKPDRPGADFADLLRERMEDAHAA